MLAAEDMECIIPSNDAVKDTVLHCTYPGTVEQNSAMWTAIAGIAMALIALGILFAALAVWRLLRNRAEGQREQLEHDAFMRYVQELERVSSSAGTPDDSAGGTRRTELRSNLRLAWYGWGLHLKGDHPNMHSLTERLADATADLAAEFDRWEGKPLQPYRVQEYNAMFARFRGLESGITVALADWKLDASSRQSQEQRLEGAWLSLNGLRDELVRWGETAGVR